MGRKKNKNKKKLEGVDEVIGDAEVYDPEKAEATEMAAVGDGKKIINYVDDIAVEIDEAVYAKIMHWIDKADGEVSGLGKIVMENGIFRVTSAILLKQENTAVSTDIDAAAVGKAMFELKDEPGHMNWWWHSHVNMDVFWSGTDMDTIHEFGNQGWVLATVLNKKREMRSCYYQKGTGFIPNLLIDDINTRTIFLASEETFTQWDEEFTSKVDEKKFKGWTWKETSRGAIGSINSPKESWEGATEYEGEYHNGFPRLPGNGDQSRFNHAEARAGKSEWWKDERDGDEEDPAEVGQYYTDDDLDALFQLRLEEMEEEAQTANSRSKVVRRAKKAKK